MPVVSPHNPNTSPPRVAQAPSVVRNMDELETFVWPSIREVETGKSLNQDPSRVGGHVPASSYYNEYFTTQLAPKLKTFIKGRSVSVGATPSSLTPYETAKLSQGLGLVSHAPGLPPGGDTSRLKRGDRVAFVAQFKAGAMSNMLGRSVPIAAVTQTTQGIVLGARTNGTLRILSVNPLNELAAYDTAALGMAGEPAKVSQVRVISRALQDGRL